MDKSSKKYQWKLTSLYASDNDPQIQADMEASEKSVSAFVDKWKDRVDYLEDPSLLREALDEFEYIFSHDGLSGKILHYYSYRYHIDMENTDLKALLNKFEDQELKLHNKLQFFQLTLGKISKEHQARFLQDENLQEYAYFLEHIFETSQHNLTEEAEHVASSLGSLAYSNWVDLIQEKLSAESREILVDGKMQSTPFAEISAKTYSSDKKERDTAAEKFNEILEDHVDTGEREFNNVLKYRQVMDTLRGYTRPDSASLLQGSVGPDIIDPLIEAVTDGFDIAQEYYQFKADILGVDALEYHERNVPVGVLKTSFDWEATKEIVLESYNRVDPEFRDLLQDMIDEGRIDVYPRKGKISGAYCWEGSKTAPVQILLNHADNINGVMTLAHEGGHALNHTFFNRTQNSLNLNCSLFVAECCSTVMEDLTLDIVKERMSGDLEAQKILAFSNLNETVSAVFRQGAGYNFETEVHAEFRKKGYLSREEIGALFTKHMTAYMGSGVKQTKGSQNRWLYWNHFRMYFYLYSYISGLLISRVLQKRLKQDPAFIEDYKKFLAFGTSKSPKDQFASIGIDITDVNFWKEGVESIRQDLKNLKAMYNS